MVSKMQWQFFTATIHLSSNVTSGGTSLTQCLEER